MIILPSEAYRNISNEKIATYQFLAKVGCPVFESILFDENEEINEEKLEIVRRVLKSDYCTIRYQYTKPCSNPIRGGNKSLITIKDLSSKIVSNTQMWLLQPIDRTKNLYGINVFVNKKLEALTIECVGKGFDVSDLNRGDVTPQESIYFNYPIEYGWQNEWWKYIKLSIAPKHKFQEDKVIRLKKLKQFGLLVGNEIFDDEFKPMECTLIETIIKHIQAIDEGLKNIDGYVVSISMNYDGKLVFWDIQTPEGKMKILRNAK